MIYFYATYILKVHVLHNKEQYMFKRWLDSGGLHALIENLL